MYKSLLYFVVCLSSLFGNESPVLFIKEDIEHSNSEAVAKQISENSKNLDIDLVKKEVNTIALKIENTGITSDWSDAVDYCNKLNLNGYNDWVLPNIKELFQIMKANSYSSASWSRTTFAIDSKLAWGATSQVSGKFDKNLKANVVCIRYDDLEQLEKACNDGNTEYCFIAADQFAKSNNFVKSAMLYKKSCEELNQSSACSSLGNLYAQGKGINKNYSEAINYYKKACDNNDAKGCILLSQIYQTGEGVEQNIYKSKYYFLLGKQDQNNDYSQVSEPIIPEFQSITEKTLWMTMQKNKINQKYAQLEEKMAFCGKNLIININDTKSSIDQKFKDADKNFKQYKKERAVLKALYSDYEQELEYIGYKPNQPFSQLDKFANIYLSTSYNAFKYMVAWDNFYWNDVDSYKKYLEYTYENIDRLKYERKIKILKGYYSFDTELSPSERVMLKKLIQVQNRAKQQELVNKFLKD